MSEWIVLDTNVISAALRGDWPDSAQEWFSRTRRHHVITAVTLMELVYGIDRMPVGRRRTDLLEMIIPLVSDDGINVLEFSAGAAMAAGALRAAREARGRALGQADAQIAGICSVHGATLATRNVRDFEGLGLELVNPWELPTAHG